MVHVLPIALNDSQIPSRVAELPNLPDRLYLCGLFPTRPMVAIVGTRRPTHEAVTFTEKFSRELVAHGFAIISGGAAGIDTAAHRGALEANGQTLVVAPSGWQHPYPESNRSLFEQVVSSNGGYVSLVEPESKPSVGHFFARNALLVAMAHATVLIQAPARSGARNAAHIARKLHRLLYVVPSAPWVEPGTGCLLELKLGARLLVTIRDLLAGLSEIGVHADTDPLQLKLPNTSPPVTLSTSTTQCPARATGATPTASAHQINPDLMPVLSALSKGRATVDEICESTGWTPPKVHGALLRLTLDGLIRVTSAGRIEILST